MSEAIGPDAVEKNSEAVGDVAASNRDQKQGIDIARRKFLEMGGYAAVVAAATAGEEIRLRFSEFAAAPRVQL